MVDYTDYITQGALARGLDPKTALHVVDTEGGRSGITGDSGTSFGPFQMHVAGTAPGTTATGLGDEMIAKGLNPQDPYQSIDYALDYAKTHGGFSPDVWHGLRSKGADLGPGGIRWTGPTSEAPAGATHLGTLEKAPGEDITGNLLLDSILRQRSALEQAEPTGNDLLDGIIKGAISGIAQPTEKPPTPTELKPEDIPRATLPQTVPELLPGAAPEVPPMRPIPALPAAARPTGGGMPAGPQLPDLPDAGMVRQPPAGAVTMPEITGPSPNRLPTIPQPQPQNIGTKPIIQPTPQRAEAGIIPSGGTGNAILDKILKGPPILTAPRGGASLIGSLLAAPSTTQQVPAQPVAQAPTQPQVMEKLLTQAGVVPPATTDIQQAQAEQRAAQAPPQPLIGMKGGEFTGRIPELAQNVLPYIAGAAPGGSLSSGIRLPTRSPELKAAIGEAKTLDDDLNRLMQQNQAKMIEVRQQLEQLPPEVLDPAVQERAYHERESRMTGAPQISAETKQIETALKPLDDQLIADAHWIYQNEPGAAKEMGLTDLMTAEEGYVHRRVQGQQAPGEHLDPSAREPITGGGRSLGRRASGLEARTPWYVIEDNAGNRRWGKGLVGSKGGPARYGESFADPGTGKRWTVKKPTTAEIEAHTPVRYQKNLIANTVDNALRISRVRRNLEVLNEWKPRLEAKGNFIPRGSKSAVIPPGFVKVDLPALEGWAQPHIADVLNDFYGATRNDFAGFLQRANKFLIGSMFALPVRHQLNVGAHYVVGRGFDNLYSNPQLARATREVASQGRDYLRLLKAGAGLRYPSVLNENFYETMLEKLFNTQVRDPQWQGIAKELGMKVSDLVKAEYAWSRRALWKVNDIFLTARIFELESKGMPTAKAIQAAEKEIPNYRIPVEVMKTRGMASFLKSPYVAFGRYAYGRGRAIAEMIKDMVGPQATGAERVHALGQAAVLVALGTGGYDVANRALNLALQGLGLRGEDDKPMEVVGAGPFGVLRTGMALAGLTDEQRSLVSELATLITPAPGPSLLMEGLGGMRDPFTGQPAYDPYGSAVGKGVQLGEAAARSFWPTAVALDAARKGPLAAIGPSLGVKEQYLGPPPRVEKRLRRGAARREARDPVQQWIEQTLGLQ